MHEKRWEFPLKRENGGRRNGRTGAKESGEKETMSVPSLPDRWKWNSCMRWKRWKNGGRERTKREKGRQLSLPSLPDWWKRGLLHEKRWKDSGRVGLGKVKKTGRQRLSPPTQTGRAEQLLWVTLA